MKFGTLYAYWTRDWEADYFMIADKCKKAGFDVDKKNVVIKNPIKAVGTYEVTAKLHTQVSVKVNVEVVAGEA